MSVRNGTADLGVYPVEVICSSQWKEGQRSEVLFRSLGGHDAENRYQTGTVFFKKKDDMCSHSLY